MKTFVGSGSGATSKALQEATSGLQTPKNDNVYCTI